MGYIACHHEIGDPPEAHNHDGLEMDQPRGQYRLDQSLDNRHRPLSASQDLPLLLSWWTTSSYADLEHQPLYSQPQLCASAQRYTLRGSQPIDYDAHSTSFGHGGISRLHDRRRGQTPDAISNASNASEPG